MVMALTDEEISQLDIVPEIFPNLLLGRSSDVNKITPYFDVGTIDNRELRPHFFDERNQTWHLRIICDVSSWYQVEKFNLEYQPMKATSTPPGAKGPPSAVQRRPFFKIHASKASLASCVRRRSGAATPCRILWLFLVVRNTAGDGFGTYLKWDRDEQCPF